MNSNNQTAQDYSDLPMGNDNRQHNSINDVGAFINSASPTSQNVTYEFYFPFFPFPLSNDARIYRVTYQYTELRPLENVRLLNNSINLSHIPDHQFPFHNNIHSLIQQQIQQQMQQQFQQPVYQQNTDIRQQFFDTTTSQVPNNNTHDTASISVNGTISDNTQDEELQNSP